LDSAASPTISLHIAAPKAQPVKLRNVVGLLRGSDPELKDTYLLVTGHYDHLGTRDNGTPDHIYNGANDDASGTSSVIEIANALSGLPRPKRSILFMTVFGEELGDLGSQYYAKHPIFPLAKTIVDLNLEQLGRTDDTEGPRVGALTFTGFDYTDLPAFFARAAELTGVKATKHPTNSDSFFRRSDNAAFADAGVPSTTIAVAFDFPDYHKPSDEWLKLDYDNMAKVDRTIALVMIDIANNATAPQWDAANPKTAQFVKAREATMAQAKK
jgi:Zn-dependent M28 family amino/carboxypeptidase